MGNESLPRRRGEETDERVCEIEPWLVIAELDLCKVEEPEFEGIKLSSFVVSDLSLANWQQPEGDCMRLTAV
ncbi:DNA helicase MCM8 [Pyrus ussuriensis x Pyrus communis]|uniref:DNA helicase MCM8 n=1 Tax=Pyrus ussuriensis x Pyrus communis TaxID=2448454 RepID=A0A5N5HL17_9ROSA|nr:DNA helicase MCM8 [Pyrus ussuriensis x Pyrus communis]